LSEAEQTLTLLSERLAERRQQVSDLQANSLIVSARLNELAVSYESLQQTLEAARESLVQSQTDLTATSTSLAALSTRYGELERQWQDYRSEMVTQIVTLERQARNARRWAAVFGVGTAVGFIVSVVLALR
jgi:chromosome segregation ATPase